MAETTRSAMFVAAAMPLLWSTGAIALEPIEELGKNVFFDDKMSIPANKQACASCHDPAKGWILPNSTINRTTVGAPGAAPHRTGALKPPASAYASLHPPFQSAFGVPGILPGWGGGNFWDGRAEGCGASAAVPNPGCPVASPVGAVSETIRWGDLPVQFQTTGPSGYVRFLGPTADQALNPFPNPVEQNTREKKVCQTVKTSKYKDLYKQAFGEEIDCTAGLRTSYKRIAVSLGAWQESSEVNQFSSKRDTALKADGKFPLIGFSDAENQGHDLFYGITSSLNPQGKNANCAACHNGLPNALAPAFPNPPPDPTGEAPQQVYTDHRYHHIGVPFNPQIPQVAKGEKVGLKGHVTNELPGFFKTPTLRNVAKGASPSFTKAYTHNGWFKDLETLVRFYNTRDELPSCESKGISNATQAEATKNGCWPEPEFKAGVVGGPGTPPAFDLIGNLGLSGQEELAIVAYLRTLDDTRPVSLPIASRR